MQFCAQPEQDESVLLLGVRRIRKQEAVLVIEDSDGVREADTVLALVSEILALVPGSPDGGRTRPTRSPPALPPAPATRSTPPLQAVPGAQHPLIPPRPFLRYIPSMRDVPRIIRAWCLYDWASSAFVTSVVVALFPPFFRSLARSAGMTEGGATAAWGYVTALSLALVALLGPFLGALADRANARKRGLALAVAVGIAATAAFALLPPGGWRMAALLFLVADLGFGCANVFYESLLPHVASPGRLDDVSTRGYALGYVGGGLLLALHLAAVQRPGWFGLPDAGAAVRAAFASVALWWALFSLPLLRDVPEPAAGATAGRRGALAAGKDAWARLAATARELRRHRTLALFLAAFWLYNDGIGTIVKMATAYGDEIGIGLADMLIALVLTQFVGIPCAIGFGRLAGRIGAKRSILVGLGVYLLISIGAIWMRTAAHFYALALAVGLVQGGTQALSRSLFSRLVPAERSGEFFGFFSTSARLAGIAGPLAFGLVTQWTGTGRWGIAILVAFFAAGGALLTRVPDDAGRGGANLDLQPGSGDARRV